MRSTHLEHIGIETLETRRMMAGDVTAVVTGGGDLVLRGDNNDNELAVVATDVAGQFEIQGLEGTTINGQQSVVVNGVFDDMRINLRDGSNAIILTGTSADGSENDFDVDDVRFSGRNGSDLLFLNQVNARGQVRANLGNGTNGVAMKDSEVGSLRVRGGNDNDGFVSVESSVEGTTDINLRQGNDAFVSMITNYGDDVRVRLGSGSDFAATGEDTFDQDLLLDGGNDTDEILTTEGGSESVVVGVATTVNFEIESSEVGFDFLRDAAGGLEGRVGEITQEFSEYIR